MPIPHLANIAREIGNHGERVELPGEIIPASKTGPGIGQASPAGGND